MEKYTRATGFNLAPEVPYRRGLHVQNFSEVRYYRVLYAQESDSSALIMVDTILSAPSKVDLIALGHDLSLLSAEDAVLMEDIMAQLGGAECSRTRGESRAQGEPADTSTAADSEGEDSADSSHLLSRQQTPHSRLRRPTHTYIPSPPRSPTPNLTPSPLHSSQPEPQTPPPSSPLPEFAAPSPPGPLHQASPIRKPTPSPPSTQHSPSPAPHSPLPEDNPPSPPETRSPSIPSSSPLSSSHAPNPPS